MEQHKEEIIESPLVQHQMAKLQITNPVIVDDCINILLFPFRITLNLLLKLNKLSKEELGYIVFSMKKEDEINLIVERIKTFRALSQGRRDAEIQAFKKTEIGNLTLVQAPTAAYYMGLCIGTGLCERKADELFIRNNKVNEVKTLLTKFKNIQPFDFADNLRLWIDYFGNVERLCPPLLVNISLKHKAHLYFRVLDSRKLEVENGVIAEEIPKVSIPLFKGETYEFEFYSFATAGKIAERDVTVTNDEICFDIPVGKQIRPVWDFDSVAKRIKELIASHNFDSEYKRHIDIVRTITGKTNFNIAQLRGGRLEYLFYKLLLVLKEQNIIDDVVWNGRLNEFGLAYPAPGGKQGDPDIYFFIDNLLLVLEVTTIRANAMQWNVEGGSVHDHIMNLRNKIKGNYKVIGLFVAPIIYSRIFEMFKHISSKEKIPLHTLSIDEVINIFQKGETNIKKILNT